MAYIVEKMKLIPQYKSGSCWYASAQMLINWKQETLGASLPITPETDAECRKIRDADNGIANSEILKMAKRLGLKAIPPKSPSPGAIENWLVNYGPLWVNGKSHIVVISGIRGNDEVQVHDPLPVNVGLVNWRTLSGWYTGGNIDARDTGNDVEAVFLHC